MHRFMAPLLLLLALAAPVWAGQPPRFNKDQHVYMMPEGFASPLFSPEAVAELEAAARQAHYPFYVVVAENPCQHLGLGGSPDACVDAAMEALAQAWVAQGYDPSRSQHFLLSFSPSKFRLHVGETYQGINRADYYPVFKSAASSGVVKNPKGGIVAVIGTLDKDIAEKADPVVLAQRAQAQAEQDRRQRLLAGREALAGRLARIATLIKDPLADPLTVGEAQSSMLRAQKLLDLDVAGLDNATIGEMKALDEVMSPIETKLKSVSEARESAAFWASFTRGLFWLLLLGTFTLLLRLLARRRLRLFEARTNWLVLSEARADLVSKNEDRQDEYTLKGDAVKLRESEGPRTVALVQQLDALVSTQKTETAAIKNNLKEAQAIAAKGSFLNVAAFEEAAAKLSSSFTYVTGPVPDGQDNPFFVDQIGTIDPSTMIQKRDQQNAQAGALWAQLRAAQGQAAVPAETLLTDSKFAGLVAKLGEYPLAWGHADRMIWYSNHNAILGTLVFEPLNATAKLDPVAFVEEVERRAASDREITNRLERLCATLDKAGLRTEWTPAAANVPGLTEDEDPSKTHAALISAIRRLTMMLRGGPENEAGLSQMCDEIASLRRKGEEQVQALIEAPARAEKAIEEMNKQRDAASASVYQAKDRRAAAILVHRNVPTVLDAEAKMAAGHLMAGEISRLLADQRVLQARKVAIQATDRYAEARSSADAVIRAIAALDSAKASYEAKVAALAAREQRVQPILNRRNRPIPQHFEPVQCQGPCDYGAMIVVVDDRSSEWERAERDVRHARSSSSGSSSSESRSNDNSPSYSDGSSWGSSSGGSSYSGGSDWGSSSGSSSGGSDSGGGGSGGGDW